MRMPKGRSLAEEQERRTKPESVWEKDASRVADLTSPGAQGKMDIPLQWPEEVPEGQRSEWLWDVYALPQPVVLITTVDLAGNVNIAPKNWVTCAGARHFAFVCSTEHDTYMNAQTTKQFVVNVPGAELVPKLHAIARRGTASWEDESTRAGLTAIPSKTVRPPRIAECRAHLECEVTLLHETSTHGDLGTKTPQSDVLVLGRIVAASADEEIVRAPTHAERVKRIRPFVLAPVWNYAVIEQVSELPHAWDLEY